MFCFCMSIFESFLVGPGPDLITHKFLRLGAYWKSVLFGNLIPCREGEVLILEEIIAKASVSICVPEAIRGII